jgi:ABC-type Na+ efflux pump permease subunit
VERRFASIVENMNLTHLETAALRLAIARDDSSIRHALEAFRDNLDEDALSNVLRRISKHTIENTLEEREVVNPADEEDEEEEEENDDDEVFYMMIMVMMMIIMIVVMMIMIMIIKMIMMMMIMM